MEPPQRSEEVRPFAATTISGRLRYGPTSSRGARHDATQRTPARGSTLLLELSLSSSPSSPGASELPGDPGFPYDLKESSTPPGCMLREPLIEASGPGPACVVLRVTERRRKVQQVDSAVVTS